MLNAVNFALEKLENLQQKLCVTLVKSISVRNVSTKALIRKDLDELEADIAPVYESIVSGIEAMSLSIIEKHDERRKTMHDLSKTCHTIVDKVFENDNHDIIKHMNSEGKLLKEITTTTRTAPADLTVTREGHLVYIDGEDRNINIVKSDRTECLIKEKDWIPGAICSTSTGDLLLLMRSEYRVEKPTKRKITRFSGSTVKQEIQLNTKNKKILTSHLAFIHENKNLDIILSDMHTESVRVLSSEGQLRFTYDGNPLLMHSKKYGKFIPRDVTTDRKGHILIADSGANIIHIIDQDGQFLLCIDNCGLQKPYGLSIDKNNILFVAELKTKAIKQIKFMLK
ncbi:uncharacterized protein LOC134243356 [Saccostrea cucullata]|uniref:uncharacterized protein LOC134243356 n=1 Tax=Saccostrea cuccullata TaxID=36930 RepID=UPI002ED03BE8